MKITIPMKYVGDFSKIILSASCFFILFFLNTANADYAEDLKDKTVDFCKVQEASPYLIKPVSKLTLQDFFYSDHADRLYCFENSEGRCLDKQNNFFTTLEGHGQYKNNFYVYYKSELNEDGQIRLKKGYGIVKIGIWSLEAGQDTIWLGPGYHGSFLLSNNAEGFPLVRLRTEEPFRLPWIFSNLGEFKYDLFRGWSENSGILGQRLSWRPMPLLELAANQVSNLLPGSNYQLSDYPRDLLFSSAEHSAGQQSSFDQKASVDIALDLPFLSKSTPFVGGKIYAEYAGNDSFNAWGQDKHHFRDAWKHSNTKYIDPIPFDFQDLAYRVGLFLTTGDMDFRLEYAQDYASYPLFYDYYLPSTNRRVGVWYTDLNTRGGMIMGDNMGNNADDLYFEFTIRSGPAAMKTYFDQQRRGLAPDVTYPPEKKYQYGLRPSYQFKSFTLFADMIYNHYRNVNYSTDPLQVDIHPDTSLDEYIAGLGVEITF